MKQYHPSIKSFISNSLSINDKMLKKNIKILQIEIQQLHMGNDLEKLYNLKQKPIRLPGSYSFLKFVDHPTDITSSLLIVKSPHKAGIINSQILLPIKSIKNQGYSQYTVATCRRCIPLALAKPKSQSEMKLILREIITLRTELGRIFLCDGRLMLWCEEIRSQWLRSPEEIQLNRQSEKSTVFCSGICLINYLHCVYEKQSKSKKNDKKYQIQAFFEPKNKKQYDDFLDNLQNKLSKSNFWNVISQGMKDLIQIMLAKQPNDRIDLNALIQLPYFYAEKQLRLYHILSSEILKYEQKQSIIAMETIEIALHDRGIFDQLILNEYITPLLIFLLQKKPQLVLSVVIQLPKPPIPSITTCIKKANPKNIRLFNSVLSKIQKLHTILDSQQYDATLSRTTFCSFDLAPLLEKLLRLIPHIMKTIKQNNYKKQIQYQIITHLLQKKNNNHKILLLALKCIIQMLNDTTLSNVNKLYNINFQPQQYQQQLQINLHILELYRLMILHIQPKQLIKIMMPKLDPYLSKEQITDQLFFKAKKNVNLIMDKLAQAKSLNTEDQINVNYDTAFFTILPLPKPPQSELISVLKKQALKSKIEDIVWLVEILERQQPLTVI